MISVVWIALGMAISACVLHAALGLRRPIHRAYLSLACIMLLLAVFLYLQVQFYRAATSEAAVETVRWQVLAAHGFIGCFLVFLPAYTGVRMPRALTAAYWSALAILVVANLWAPHGLWFSTAPELVRSTFLGEEYSAVVPPPMALPQYAYTLYYLSLLVVGFACALKMFRRGERQRGAMLAIGLAVILGLAVADLVRDSIGASWPYVATYGIVMFGLVMSVQLAHDFRVQADSLATMIVRAESHAEHQQSILEALQALERGLHGPADVLETGMGALGAESPREESYVRRLQRAVTRLRELGRSMPRENRMDVARDVLVPGPAPRS